MRFKAFDDFMQNYHAVVTPLNVVNDSMKIWSTTANGLYFVDGTTTNIIITPTLTPNTLIMLSPEIIRTANVVQMAC